MEYLRTLRVGIVELHSELAEQASRGGDELQKVSSDNARITLILESLMAENDELWKSSVMQDKLMCSSGDMISTLTQRVYVGDIKSFKGSVQQGAERELVEGRLEKLVSSQVRLVEEKWARKLDSETEQLNIQLRVMRSAYEEEASKVQALQAALIQDTETTSQQLNAMEQRIKAMMTESLTLREQNTLLTLSNQQLLHELEDVKQIFAVMKRQQLVERGNLELLEQGTKTNRRSLKQKRRQGGQMASAESSSTPPKSELRGVGRGGQAGVMASMGSPPYLVLKTLSGSHDQPEIECDNTELNGTVDGGVVDVNQSGFGVFLQHRRMPANNGDDDSSVASTDIFGDDYDGNNIDNHDNDDDDDIVDYDSSNDEDEVDDGIRSDVEKSFSMSTEEELNQENSDEIGSLQSGHVSAAIAVIDTKPRRLKRREPPRGVSTWKHAGTIGGVVVDLVPPLVSGDGGRSGQKEELEGWSSTEYASTASPASDADQLADDALRHVVQALQQAIQSAEPLESKAHQSQPQVGGCTILLVAALPFAQILYFYWHVSYAAFVFTFCSRIF